jgi:hypothetical protein
MVEPRFSYAMDEGDFKHRFECVERADFQLVLEWAEKHFGSEWGGGGKQRWFVWASPMPLLFVKDEDDAFHFRMRWC